MFKHSINHKDTRIGCALVFAGLNKKYDKQFRVSMVIHADAYLLFVMQGFIYPQFKLRYNV